MKHIKELKALGKIETPRKISFDATVSSKINAINTHLSSMASNNPFSILSEDNKDNDFLKTPVQSCHVEKASTTNSINKNHTVSTITNYDQHFTSDSLDDSTSSISTSPVKQFPNKNEKEKEN